MSKRAWLYGISWGLVLWLLILIAVVSIAKATEPLGEATPVEEARAPDARTAEFLDAARGYWGRMLPGRAPTRAVVVAFVDDQFMETHALGGWAGALSDIRGYRIWINRSWWNSYSNAESDRLCTGFAHEYGHLLGLGHPATYPIMTGDLYDHIPVECGGPDASGNPYLAQTLSLYGRKRDLQAALHTCRVRADLLHQGRSRCRPLRHQLARTRTQIEALEG